MKKFVADHGCGWVLLCLCFVLAGCSRKPQQKVYPVRGVVTYRNMPAHKAMVVLRPVLGAVPGSVDQPLLPHGEVQSDGSFVIGTFSVQDGAPIGEYAVVISWPQVKLDADGSEMDGGDRLGGKYLDATKSLWKVQIKEGENELEPFRLE